MNTEWKRRAFLAGIVGTLIGAPIAARFLLDREPDEGHRFTDQLKHYQKRLQTNIVVAGERGPIPLTLTPPSEAEWTYVLFSQSFLPTELSRATIGEPDTYLVREGHLFSGTTQNGMKLLGGGDSCCRLCSPIGTEEKTLQAVTLICRDERLRRAKPKGTSEQAHSDKLLRHLLALENSSHQNLKTGKRWRSILGRVKPFGGYSTDYEVVGFAELDGRAVVDVAFSGTVHLTAPLPERSGEKTAAPKVTNRHRGHAWFDLETGFLLRQETEQEAVAVGIPGYKAKDGSDSISVTTQTIFHLFTS